MWQRASMLLRVRRPPGFGWYLPAVLTACVTGQQARKLSDVRDSVALLCARPPALRHQCWRPLQQLTLSPVRTEDADARPQFSSGSDDSGDDSDDSAVTPADLSQDSEDTTDSEPGEGGAETVANNGRTHGKPVSPSEEEEPSAPLSSLRPSRQRAEVDGGVSEKLFDATTATAEECAAAADEKTSPEASRWDASGRDGEEDDDDDGEECFAGDDTGPIGGEDLERVAQDLLVDPPAGVASRIGRAALDGVVSAAEQEADLRLVARAGAALLQRAGKAEQVPAFLVRVIAGLPRCEEVRLTPPVQSCANDRLSAAHRPALLSANGGSAPAGGAPHAC